MVLGFPAPCVSLLPSDAQRLPSVPQQLYPRVPGVDDPNMPYDVPVNHGAGSLEAVPRRKRFVRIDESFSSGWSSWGNENQDAIPPNQDEQSEDSEVSNETRRYQQAFNEMLDERFGRGNNSIVARLSQTPWEQLPDMRAARRYMSCPTPLTPQQPTSSDI